MLVILVVLSGVLPTWRGYTNHTPDIFSYFWISRTNFKMSSKDLLSPCINRFKVINQPTNHARLDFVIYSYQLDSDVPKKNINTSQFSRKLKPVLKRLELKPISSNTLEQMQISRKEKQSLVLKKPHLRLKKPKLLLKN